MSCQTTSDSLVAGQVKESLRESCAVVTAEAVDRRNWCPAQVPVPRRAAGGTGKSGHVHGAVSMYVSRCPKGI